MAADANSTATVVVAGVGGAAPARFSVATPPATPPPTPTAPAPAPLHYAALDLQPRRAPQPRPPRTYTQIDFVRSEKLNDSTSHSRERLVVNVNTSSQRFPPTPTAPAPAPLHYAALDLQPRRAPQPRPPRTYTQIDFVRSEKLHAADAT
ncbi:uncharacterized protein LOC135078744 [Ostrinia nubilalis]|uniref:uncharacterized protein LOC135078744 n=1 Tax=Ostrinia nubilalis TaxID=29057 RepID=UPI0030823349